MIGYPERANQEAELALTNPERVLLKENRKKDKKLLVLFSKA